MNKRERREKYLSTRRPAEFLAEWKRLCQVTENAVKGKTLQERFDAFVEAGLLSRDNMPPQMEEYLKRNGVK